MGSWAKMMSFESRSALGVGALLAAVCLLAGPVSAQNRNGAGPGPAIDPSARSMAAEAVETAPVDAEEILAAEEPAETAAEDPPVDPATLTSPLEASIELDRLMERGRFDAALDMGARMVELTERDFGRNHTRTAEAYVRLADAQRRAREHDLAVASYHTA